MRYTGIQPQYFPRLHYFARILNTDVFCVRDDCQYVDAHTYPDGSRGKSYQSHSPIRSDTGVYLLTIPIRHMGRLPISKTKIQYNMPWSSQHARTIQNCYSKTPNVREVTSEIDEVLRIKHDSLAELNLTTIFWGILKLLGENIKLENLNLDYVSEKLLERKDVRLKKIILGSSLDFLTSDSKLSPNEKIIKICQHVGATEDYCGGTAMNAYMNVDLFKKNGILPIVQDWKCPEYPQKFSDRNPFIPNLSIIDLFMSVSAQRAREILAF